MRSGILGLIFALLLVFELSAKEVGETSNIGLSVIQGGEVLPLILREDGSYLLEIGVGKFILSVPKNDSLPLQIGVSHEPWPSVAGAAEGEMIRGFYPGSGMARSPEDNMAGTLYLRDDAHNYIIDERFNLSTDSRSQLSVSDIREMKIVNSGGEASYEKSDNVIASGAVFHFMVVRPRGPATFLIGPDIVSYLEVRVR